MKAVPTVIFKTVDGQRFLDRKEAETHEKEFQRLLQYNICCQTVAKRLLKKVSHCIDARKILQSEIAGRSKEITRMLQLMSPHDHLPVKRPRRLLKNFLPKLSKS
jgi:hypothetical protein